MKERTRECEGEDQGVARLIAQSVLGGGGWQLVWPQSFLDLGRQVLDGLAPPRRQQAGQGLVPAGDDMMSGLGGWANGF